MYDPPNTRRVTQFTPRLFLLHVNLEESFEMGMVRGNAVPLTCEIEQPSALSVVKMWLPTTSDNAIPHCLYDL